MSERADPGAVPVVVDTVRVIRRASGVSVVDGLSMSIGVAEIRGLVGESGCGKTAVAHALLGYARRGLHVESGRVLLDGVDILTLAPARLRALRGRVVSYVPQDPAAALNPNLRIATQLKIALQVHGRRVGLDDELPEVLARVRLPDPTRILRSYPHQLSGGQQQRVMLALAFAARPRVIVLDEPTTGLDVSTQRHILEIIRELCTSSGASALYVSHDLAVVREIADSITVMYAGEAVEEGPAAEVLARPQHPYTAALVRAVPVLGATTTLEGINGAQPWPEERRPACLFAPRCPAAIAACTTSRPPLVRRESRAVRCIRSAAELSRVGRTEPGAVEAPASGQPLLAARGVVAAFGASRVLDGVDLSVAARRCVALVGESGSGKTTLARCLVGMHPISAGEITLDGQLLPPRLKDRSKAVLRRIQFVFQNPYASLNPRRTIGQTLAEALLDFQQLKGSEVDARVARALTDVALGTSYMYRYPDQLSGGERQRAAIARAVIVEPDVLICDEVTSALDVSVQAVVVELLRRLQAERELSMLFITHNMALVGSIAQEVVVLSDGKIVEAGPTEQVLKGPRDDYTRRLMSDTLKGPSGDPVVTG